MMTMYKQLLLIAAVSVFVFSGQAAYAQNVNLPGEPTPPNTESPKPPSRSTRAIQILLDALRKIICEEERNCPTPVETPTETAEPARLARRPTTMGPERSPIPVVRSFSYQTPRGWQAYDGRSSVTIAPPSEYVNGTLSNGVVFGLADLNGASFESGADRYVQNMLSANSYLRRVGRPERNSANTVACITTRFAGLSPQTGYTENVVVHTCPHTAQKLLYVVNVNSGPNATRYDEENNRIIQSISFR